MQEIYVDTPAALAALCKQLQDSEWIALDTEFIREKTYYPKLCLFQVSNGDVAACVDPLRLDDLQPLLDVLYDGRILKILHAARQDLEIFLHDYQRLPMPIFDTQPAAALLGYGDQIGYANLVKLMLDIELPKDQSRTDWMQRPLDPQQQRYALDDVIYLGKLYLHMRANLFDRERLQWLAADFAPLADPETYYPDPIMMWRRIKGRQALRGRQLAILQQLAAWREREARRRDLPRKWIIKDDLMVELSRRQPTNAAGLSKIRGLEPGLIRREGDQLLTLIAAGRDLPQEEWPGDPPRPRQLQPGEEAAVDLLSAALRLIAAQHQLSPQSIATRKELENLVRGDQPSQLHEGWRKAVAGTALSRVLNGDLLVECEQGQARLVETAEEQG